MRQMWMGAAAVVLMFVGAGCSSGLDGGSGDRSVRIAVFNASLNRNVEGKLLDDLSAGDDPQIRNVAEVIQRVRPDILLVAEFDYFSADPKLAAQLFRQKYLGVSQSDRVPVDFPYAFVAPVNTGVPSGFDLDRSGAVVSARGERQYGNDSLGWGEFPGQFGMLVLSRFPIDVDNVRTFQKLRWKNMPGALLPTVPDSGEPWYSPEALEVLPLTSKSHWDIPIRLPGRRILHVLAAHPTPPSFDGPEDRNGKRNHDEIRLFADYLTGGDAAGYIVDDNGRKGGLEGDASFVIVGDYNADPADGNSVAPGINQLLDHPRVLRYPAPTSVGGAAAVTQGGSNTSHKTPADTDTADFTEPEPGNLRVDYVLPSRDFRVTASGVFWPGSGVDGEELVRMRPRAATSDHRLVWIDVKW